MSRSLSPFPLDFKGFGSMVMAVDSPSQKPGGAAVLDKAPERVRKRSPRYKVLLHNDPVNSMEYVVATLQQVVPQLSEQDCICLLYTSPSPRDATLSRMPSSA